MAGAQLMRITCGATYLQVCFSAAQDPCGEVMLNIWFKLVGSLVARNVRTRRSRNGKVKVYMLKWGGSIMMLESLTRPKWNYLAPRWLFSITAPNVVHGM